MAISYGMFSGLKNTTLQTCMVVNYVQKFPIKYRVKGCSIIYGYIWFVNIPNVYIYKPVYTLFIQPICKSLVKLKEF